MSLSQNSRLAFLDLPGEMAELIREKNWAETPFGPIEGWSPALRSAVSICLGSRFPMVLYWGEERAIIYNDAWSVVPGRKHPWMLGQPGAIGWSEIWDIIGPMFDHIMGTGEATWSEDQLLPLNRFGYVEECYFYYSFSPVRGEDGTVEGIFTAVTETTYRVLAERRERLLREISEATSQSRSAEEACRVAVARMDQLPEESPFCLAYLRDTATGDLKLMAIAGLAPSEDLAPEVIKRGEDGTPWCFEAATHAASSVDGLAERFADRLPSRPWPEPVVEAIVAPILSAHPDAPSGFLVSGVSPRRRANPEYVTLFERAAAHIATAIVNIEAYEEERRRSEKLAELDRAKTAFFSNASHEFRTPLTLMLGPVEDMLSRGGPAAVEVARPDLELVHRNGQRLLRLVNTLLDFSRIEAGRMSASVEPVDLGAYTAELASTFRSAMERAGLGFEIDCGALSRPVQVDREMWEKIVLNLISNAFKYTLDGSVTLTLEERAGEAALVVKDTGVGIPETEIDRIFERFHRIEGQTGRTHEGTGIGLALVKELASLHGGSIAVESRLGQGSTFTVRVPFEQPGSATAPSDRPLASTAVRTEAFVAEALRWLPGEDEAPAVDTGAANAGRGGAGETILLADDNADMRGYVERLLTDAGYRVEAVGDGRAALDAARHATPDLILTDVMMPVLDGFGLLKELRADPATADTPIIMLSARAGEEASIEGFEAGADDYLVKPFSARELTARVEGALRLSRMRRDSKEALRVANEDLEQRVFDRTRERDRSWTLSQDLIGVADSSGIWQAVNPAWTRVLGWDQSDIVGRTSEWMEHPDDMAKTRAEVRKIADGNTTIDFENRFRRKDGAYCTLAWTAVPEGGLMYCVARDVTEERERAVELRETREALFHAQKMESIGQLTGGIAHDFNNLLGGIIGSIDLLKRRIDQGRIGEIGKYLDAATTSANRAAALTARLLAFGRRQTLDVKPTDVNHVVRGLEDLIRRTIGEGIAFETALAPDAWPATTDANQLESALLNLAINARDAMPEGGRLTISTENKKLRPYRGPNELSPGDYLLICVKDTGVGMEPDVVGQAFDPFFTTKPIGQGTGLGLSMTYGFAKQVGGTVHINSRPGEGAQICLFMPRAEKPAIKDEPLATAMPEGSGEDVLVVEDDPALRMLVIETLDDLGYRAIEAADGKSALEVLKSPKRLDLMISDVGLPGGMNGRQLADLARTNRPDLKVLFITGYAEGAGVRSGFLDDGMDMITKPFSLDTLATKIREMISVEGVD